MNPADEPIVIEPRVFPDDRGFLYETYNKAAFEALIGVQADFVQDNHSHSRRGVLRGLHYQLPPAEQGKLVQVVAGEILDVVVDVRRSSPAFGEWLAYRLSSDNHLQLWVPPGYAHGFLVISDTADVVYKMTTYHEPTRARSVAWNDPAIGIDWPLDDIEPILSTKDQAALMLDNAETFD